MLTIETLEKRCEICSKLTIKTPERRQWRRPGVFIVNFEHTLHLFLIFLLLTLSTQLLTGCRQGYSDQVTFMWSRNF